MRLWRLLKKAMLKKPKQTISEGDNSITNANLVIFVEMFSKNLSNEKCCAILCNSEMMAAKALLSCFAARVTAVPLSLRYGEIYCNKILDMISPTSIITDADGELQIIHLKKSQYSSPKKHPALIMCTSGTTGKPKGAMLTEKNIISNLKDISNYFNISDDDSILIARPLYHCAVLTGELLTALFNGTKIFFCSEKFNPQMLLNMIRDLKITVFCATPTLLDMLSRFNRSNSDMPLKKICVSGECLSLEVGKRILSSFKYAEIYHVYGLTEASPRVSFLAPKLFSDNIDCVGIPLKSVHIKLLKFDGTHADINEEGVLWIKGKNIMAGYYNDSVLTRKVFKNGWLCTGDIGVINSKGLLKIKGRCDDLIIRAGMNIYPREIEDLLKTDKRVREVVAYKIGNSKTGNEIGLKLTGDFTDTAQVKQLCIELLPVFQIPTVIELMDELPKNVSGKIIRR